MSSVTNVIVTWPIFDEEITLDQINSYKPFSLKLVKECCQGGTKYLEHNIAVGAVNYLDIDEFVRHLKSIKSENIRLFVCGQDDEHFRMVEL